MAARGAEGTGPTPETEPAVARQQLLCPAPRRAGEPRPVVRLRASPDPGRPGLPHAQRAGRVPPREPGHPGPAQAFLERGRRRAERSVPPAGRAGPHPFRQRSGVRRQGRAAMDLCGRRPHGLPPAGIPPGERIHRKLPRTAAGRAPERGDLPHPEGGPDSHRIPAPSRQRRASAQQLGIPTPSPGNDHARLAGQTGGEAAHARTFALDPSMGADHRCSSSARFSNGSLSQLRLATHTRAILPKPADGHYGDGGSEKIGSADRHHVGDARVTPLADPRPRHSAVPPSGAWGYVSAERNSCWRAA